jgi:hypothetical protein
MRPTSGRLTIWHFKCSYLHLMKYRLVVVIAAIVSLSATAVLADFGDDDRHIVAEVDRNAVVHLANDVEVRSLAGSLAPAQLDEFTALAEKGVADIARFTGVEPPKERILIYLSPRIGISHTYPHYPASLRHEPRVFLDSERVAEHSAPYLHELVHAVIGDGGSMWLEEGFASWVASSVAGRYGGYYAPVLSGGNDRVDAQARRVIEHGGGAYEAANWFASDEPELSQRQRPSFYILSHSFTKFLASTLGTKRLVAIHRANNPRALTHVTGVPMAEWRSRWLAELGEGNGRVAAGR